MISYLIKILFKIRKLVMKNLKPSDIYLGARKIKPVSDKYGYDRGTPIDRYYIDKFIRMSKRYISGVCLEVGDSRYTSEHGENVTRSDVLDIKKSKHANIIGDIRNLKRVIKSDTYDCIILTQVLGMIDDLPSVVRELHRILKVNGVVLVTSSFIAPSLDTKNYWRLSENSLRYLFSKHFHRNSIQTHSYGNNLSSRAYWMGLSLEELTKKEIEYIDLRYPIIVSLIAKK